MNATSSLDFAYEAASAMCIFIQNVGRMAESLLLWNMGEVGISRLNLKYCSYSTSSPKNATPWPWKHFAIPGNGAMAP